MLRYLEAVEFQDSLNSAAFFIRKRFVSMGRFAFSFLLGLTLGLTGSGPQAEGKAIAIEKGRRVAFDYTLIVDGKVVDSSQGRGPLKYTHGEGQIISGLSRQLEGLTVGDERTIKVPPEEAYGEVNKDAFREVTRSSLPKDLGLKAGMYLKMQTADKQEIPVKVAEVKKDSVVLDLNHPLAGKFLIFKVKIVSIE